MGLHRAGFEVVGVDNRPQPNYPFAFVRGDALRPPVDLAAFDFIWASPPCQAFCTMQKEYRARHPNLIEPVRRMLTESRAHYCIENIPRAPLLQPIQLCGSTFGLRVRRHRHFESSLLLWEQPCRHREQGKGVGVYGHAGNGAKRAKKHGGPFVRAVDKHDAGDAMGIDWMTWRELTQAIPPVYSEFIGRQIARQIARQISTPPRRNKR